MDFNAITDSNWYYVDPAGATKGPHTVAQLKPLYGSVLKDTTYIWNGTTVLKWTALNKVPDIWKQIKPQPAPPNASPNPPSFSAITPSNASSTNPLWIWTNPSNTVPTNPVWGPVSVSGSAQKSNKIVIPKEAQRLAPTPCGGTLVSSNGRLLCFQQFKRNLRYDVRTNSWNESISDTKFNGILRYDVRANSWNEWIPYPKGMPIFVGHVVVDEKRQMIYMFDGPQQFPTNAYPRWITIWNVAEKTFENDYNIPIYRHEGYPIPLSPVLLGDVIYMYPDSDKCLKWNVETNQVDEVSGAYYGISRAAWYCDMQYVLSILYQ